MSGTPIAGDYIKAEGKAGRMGARLMAIVAEGERGRVYLAPNAGAWRSAARQGKASVEAGIEIFQQALGISRRQLRPDEVGRPLHARQLVALTTFSDLVQEARERVKRDALAAGLPDDGKSLARRWHWRHRLRRCGGGLSWRLASTSRDRSVSSSLRWDQRREQSQRGLSADRQSRWSGTMRRAILSPAPLETSSSSVMGSRRPLAAALPTNSEAALSNDAATQTISRRQARLH